jgi:small subunit ribosomal protein S21
MRRTEAKRQQRTLRFSADRGADFGDPMTMATCNSKNTDEPQSGSRRDCTTVAVGTRIVHSHIVTSQMKKKMQREGIFREMRLRKHYEKPSEKKVREKAEAIRRARKRMQREGHLPMKPRVTQGTSERHRPRALASDPGISLRDKAA